MKYTIKSLLKESATLKVGNKIKRQNYDTIYTITDVKIKNTPKGKVLDYLIVTDDAGKGAMIDRDTYYSSVFVDADEVNEVRGGKDVSRLKELAGIDDNEVGVSDRDGEELGIRQPFTSVEDLNDVWDEIYQSIIDKSSDLDKWDVKSSTNAYGDKFSDKASEIFFNRYGDYPHNIIQKLDRESGYKSRMTEWKGQSATDGLSHIVRDLNTGKIEPQMLELSPDIVSNMKQIGLTSADVYQFSALFSNNSFKIEHILNGKLNQVIKSLYLDKEVVIDKILKVDLLKAIVQAMDTTYGNRTWTKQF